jgi:multiple sugar transport system ATP-binding protein
MAMGDRVVVLHKGVVRQIGTPKQVYDDPADTFVATFLGSPPMNLLTQDDVIVGFRPEHFRPVGAARPGNHIPFKYRVDIVEYLGNEWIVYGHVQGGRFDGQQIISRLPATIATGSPQENGGVPQDFVISEQDLKFFDRSTGKRTAAKSITLQ